MPGRYTFDGALLRLTFEDETPLDDVRQLMDDALADPICSPRPNLLVDMRGSTSFAKLSAEGVRRGAAIFAERHEELGARFAVVTATPVQYGLMRMDEATADFGDLEIQIFGDIEEAMRWAGSD